MVKKRIKHKRKVSKKRRKSPRRHKKSEESGHSISRKDFETFQIGVGRLKELRIELKSLNTSGFKKEEQTIKSKLKNVAEIPNIEKQLKILKLKIRKKYHPKRKPSKTKLIRKDIESLKGAISRLGSKVKKEKTRKQRIDSGVGILVDTNFNSFLNEIKTSLSNRVKSKEKQMDDSLSVDLQKREQGFHEKRINLIREFNEKKKQLDRQLEKKYASKVKATLAREVSEKFNQVVQNKLDAEKVRLGKKYIAELKEHAKTQLIKEKQKLHNKLRQEFARAEMRITKQKDALKDYKDKIKNRLVEQSHKQVEKEVAKSEKEIKTKLRNEFELRLKKHIQEHEAEMKKKKLDLELEVQKKLKQALA